MGQGTLNVKMDNNKCEKWKISVVIPVYNSERFLSECIESVREQTYRNLEIILVDDGSTDTSRSICKEYCCQDQRVHLIPQDHKGVSAARNCGLDAITGDYVLFLDSDDLLHPSLITEYVAIINKNAPDYIYCGYTPFITLPKTPSTQEKECPEPIFYSTERARELFHYGPFFRGIGGKLIRTDYIGEIRFSENITWAEDALFNYEMILQGGAISFFNAGWYYYRQHSDSTCSTIKDRSTEQLEFMKVLRDFELQYANRLNNALSFALLWEKNLIRTIASSYVRVRKEKQAIQCHELRKHYHTEVKNPLLKKLSLYDRMMFFICFHSPSILHRLLLKIFHMIEKGKGRIYGVHEHKKPVYHMPQKKDSKQLSITLDATYGADNTSKLLHILQKYDVKATFFVSGIWAEAYPQKVREIVAAGCEVGNHSDTHTHLKDCPRDYVIREIEECNRKVEEAAGVCPRLMRCPFGEYDTSILELIDQRGMKAIQWSVDSLDWKESMRAQDIYDRIISKANPGGIILCHNAGLYTPEVLEKVLQTLLQQGYEFVTVSELLGEPLIADGTV